MGFLALEPSLHWSKVTWCATMFHSGSLKTDGLPFTMAGVSAIHGNESESQRSAISAIRLASKVPSLTFSFSEGARPGRPKIAGADSPLRGRAPPGIERAQEKVEQGGDIIHAV